MKRTIIVVLLLSALTGVLGCGARAGLDVPMVYLIDKGKKQGTIPIAGEKGQVMMLGLKAIERHHYSVCIAPEYGDADLYGSFNGVLQSSKNRGEWKDQGLPMRDCLTFEVFKGGIIYLKVKTIQKFKGSIYFIGHPYDHVPRWFEKKLISPLSKVVLTSRKWGPVGSPWGNDLAEFNPFADKDHDGFLHSGTDMYAPAGTPVRAACTGRIHRNGMLDDLTPSEWGGYTILECKRGGTTLVLGYDHIIPGSQPEVGTEVKQGQIIGIVYKMLAKGERDHLHFTICVGTYDECAAQKQQPQRGSIHYTMFPGRWIESDPRKNQGLFFY